MHAVDEIVSMGNAPAHHLYVKCDEIEWAERTRDKQ